MPLSKTLPNPASTLLSSSSVFAAALAISACVGEGDASAPMKETDVAPAALAEAQTASPATDPDTAAAAPSAAGTTEEPATRVCRELMVRGRDCSAVFVPALVTERVRLDIPAGITAYAAKVGDDALLSEALDEFAEDSQDERIAAMCSELAGKLPAERRARLVSSGQACLALDGCDPFVSCAVPISIQPE